MKTEHAKIKCTKLGYWQKMGRAGGICERCKNTFEHLTVDHRIPKYLLIELGATDLVLDWEENFELLCFTCNSFKGNKIDITDGKSIDLLKKLIERI